MVIFTVGPPTSTVDFASPAPYNILYYNFTASSYGAKAFCHYRHGGGISDTQ